jgi:hypothetical protein
MIKVEVGMQRVAAMAWSPSGDRKIYAVWIAIVWAAILAGFGMDFTRYLGEGPPPPFILHIHAAVYVLWLGLVSLQILWVETGNLRRHKQLGWLTVAVSALMVPSGLAAALVDVRRSRALDRRDHRDPSQRLANMARHDGSAGQCLGLCRLNLTDTCFRLGTD